MIRAEAPPMLSALSRIFRRSAAPGPIATVFVPPYDAAPSLSVTPETGIRIAAAKRAVELIAGSIARLDAKSVSGPGAALVVGRPNRVHSQYELRRTLAYQAAAWGNGFAFIARNGAGDPVELQLLAAESVGIDSSYQSPAGEYGVRYRHPQLGQLRPEDLVHLKAPSATGVLGLSPIRQAAESMAFAKAVQRSGTATYANGGVSKLALIHPGKLSPEAAMAIADAYVARHSGADAAGRPVVLADNMRVEKISSSLEDSAFVEAAQFSIQEISRIFGVPVAYLSDHSNSSYGSLEALMRIFVDGCLADWAEQLRAELVDKVLGPGGSLSWDYSQLLRPGFAETMAGWRTGIEAGFVTRNEAREAIGFEPVDGLDSMLLAKNMGTGGGATQAGTDTDLAGGAMNTAQPAPEAGAPQPAGDPGTSQGEAEP